MSATDDSRVHEPFRIAIVGGGLGGLALAIGLIKHGIDVHIYEAAATFSEIGAGVAFGPNSVRALGLIDKSILRGYRKHATFNEDPKRQHTFLSFRYGMDSRNGNGKTCGDLIMHMEDDQDMDKWTGTRTRSCIHRARFLDELVQLIPAGITSFGKALTTMEHLLGEESDVNSVLLHFSDGSTVTADAVIGCDGIKSKTREIILGNNINPKFTGEYAYRALIPRDAALKALGEELACNGQLYCGYGGYIITYPVEHGELTNIVAVRRKDGATWEDSQWVVPSTKDEMLRDFEGWHPAIIDLLSRSWVQGKWSLFDLQHSAKYSEGNVCLLGDSAHASAPHIGAGAGMAMEDAFILSNLMSTVRDQAELQRAFQAFDTVRRPRTQRVVKYSMLAGLAYEFMKEDVRDDLSKLQTDISARFKWLWHEDLEAQLLRAKELMK
ncbi:mannitol 1-phosphate dehydrogenase [Glonium stellatum]|uniref:Mannitol 1-phosphate dehydrogenase n=1 Tax=Glonium stellatum TaxID=574774 RepID=A0A8E2EZG5_9PEZI|nr:mannitol 1-phosphate dehydrogenase [Glonium stellatum]